MLEPRLYKMNVSRLVAEQSIIKNRKFLELSETGLKLKEIFSALSIDKELQQITKLIINKAIDNRIEAEVKRGIFKKESL